MFDSTISTQNTDKCKCFVRVWLKRSKWVVKEADLVIAYVTYYWGGAAKTLEYAKRKKKTIINLASTL